MLKELKLTCTIRNEVLLITTPEDTKEANREIADYAEAIRVNPQYAESVFQPGCGLLEQGRLG